MDSLLLTVAVACLAVAILAVLTLILVVKWFMQLTRELCNRLQAGTLSDYAAHKHMVEMADVETRNIPAVGTDLGSEDYEVPNGPSPEAIAQVQSDLRDVLSY